MATRGEYDAEGERGYTIELYGAPTGPGAMYNAAVLLVRIRVSFMDGASYSR